MPMPSESLAQRRLHQSLEAGFAQAAAGPQRRFDQAELVDAWLTGVWGESGAPASGAALAATGSLGRRELGPGSDLDLVLLVDPEALTPDAAAPLAGRLWYPIWESGTVLDPTVRTPQECEDAAREDLQSAIDLLDLRWVAGDPALVRATADRVQTVWTRTARHRVAELAALVRQRSASYAELSQSAQPNLLSDRGGLRDRVTLHALVRAGLARDTGREIDRAAALLLDARDALQVVTGSSSTRIGQGDRDAVAALTGHPTAEVHRRELAAAARLIAWRLHRSLEAAAPEGECGSGGTSGQTSAHRSSGAPTGSGDVLGTAVTGLAASEVPSTRSDLAAVVRAAVSGRPLAGGTLARLALAPARPFGAIERDLLLEALAAEHFPTVYEDLDLVGIFSRWVPAWTPVRNLPQRSDVHRFTVDRHQVETVHEARPLLAHVNRPDLLLAAALLHDLGKQNGLRDHADAGAPLAAAAARHLGFDPADAAVIATLVRQHLTLVRLATGRNLSHPAVVTELLEAIGADPDVLELLRCLTEADARAAGSAAWPDWRRDLVDHLTGLARTALAGRPSAPRTMLTPQRAAQEAVREAVLRSGTAQVLFPAPTRTDPVREICLGAPDAAGVFSAMSRLIARRRLDVRSALVVVQDGVALATCWIAGPLEALPSPGELRAALDAELTVGEGALEPGPPPAAPPVRAAEAAPVVTVLPATTAGTTAVQVNAPNRPGLLADLTTTIARHRLQVRAAQVTTLGPRAVDVLHVSDALDRALDDARTRQLVEDLREAAGT